MVVFQPRKCCYSPHRSYSEHINIISTEKTCRSECTLCEANIVDSPTIGCGMRGYDEVVERVFEMNVGFAVQAGVGLSERDLNLRI